MSVAVSSWVWKHSKAGGADRLLLLAIADVADDDGDNAWPSVATLASKVRVSERTVQRGIQKLEAMGCIEVHRGRGRHGTHRYRVVMTPAAADPPAVDSPVEEPNVVAEGVSDCHPDNLSEGVTELCRPGGDTAVSPERPERPTTPPNPPSRGAKCTHGRKSCRRCGTSPRGADRRELLAAAQAAAAEVDRIERERDELPPCRHPDCDPETRWRSTDRGERRCPDCHPDVVVGRPTTEQLELAALAEAMARAG